MRREKIEKELLPCGCIIIKNPTAKAQARVFVYCREGHEKPVVGS